ncbi:MAG: hemin transporter HemP [Gammaproteobacteria bacterium]|nr:hemin transporter HemP [Gammaproteobacteria bacterium]
MTTEKAQNPQPTLSSEAIFKGQHSVFIEHNGKLYTLRITSNDKLILTK